MKRCSQLIGIGHLLSDIFLLSVLLAGCATTIEPVSTFAKQPLLPDEGQVVGSMVVRIPNAEKDDVGFWRALLTDKSSKYKYGIYIGKKGQLKGYIFDVIPGEEKYFSIKLTDGEYKIEQLRASFSNYTARLDLRFSVIPGETVYVGKLLILVPPRLPGRIKVVIEDDQKKALSVLIKDSGIKEHGIVKRLMVNHRKSK